MKNKGMPKEKNGTMILDQMKAIDVIKFLETDAKAGLKKAEIEKRLKRYGYNEVPEEKASPMAMFLRKFWGLTPWMLELIIILSWILHKWPDVFIVSGLLVTNSIIGFLEEQRASSTVEALKKKLQTNARALRDGRWSLIPARELVPGDIVRVRAGDFIPADFKIMVGELAVDQSALTGESFPVDKKAEDILYSGSVIKRGEADGVIILTGANTYFGKTTQLIQIARPKLHMEEVVAKLVKWLLGIIGTLSVVTLLFSALRGMDVWNILPLMLVLLLSAIPVALPVMFTVSMAIGAHELAKRNVLITRLSATEDAATMDVLCVDKTGTITLNELAISQIIPLNGFEEDEVILYGALASQEANQDPMDLAFINLAKQKNLSKMSFIQKSFVPFDSKTRKTESLIQKDNQQFSVMKGAVPVIAQACGLDQQAVRELEARLDEFSKKGYRTLAVAKIEGAKAEFVGLVALHDRPRPDSKTLIQELQELGLSVKMLTGDSLPIAEEIGREVGLGEKMSQVSELKNLIASHPSEAIEMIITSNGFAEVYPEDKYLIVKHLQSKGYVVGMTGDGVNDAPALKQAEVGIAVNNATDVAKASSSVVLTSEGLSSIVELVKNGRKVYQRINTWLINKIMRTILKSSFVVGVFLITGKFAVTAFAMILLVFMTDFVKISLATDHVRWSKFPNTWKITGFLKLAIVLGGLMALESLGLLWVGLKNLHLSLDDPSIQTFGFEILFFSAVFSVFVVRERKHFWNSMPSQTLLNVIILDVLAGMIISTIGIPGALKPLPLSITFFVIVYNLIFSFIVNDFVKYYLIKKWALGN